MSRAIAIEKDGGRVIWILDGKQIVNRAQIYRIAGRSWEPVRFTWSGNLNDEPRLVRAYGPAIEYRSQQLAWAPQTIEAGPLEPRGTWGDRGRIWRRSLAQCMAVA